MKYLAVVLVLMLEVFAALFLYSTPAASSAVTFVIPTTAQSSSSTAQTTTTTAPVPDKVSVKSPAIIVNDTVEMEVHNLGPSETNLLTVWSVCTPSFKSCYSYKALSGSTYQSTFDLPAGKTFLESLKGVCTVAIKGCADYLPVVNATYYLELNFTFADHSVVTVPVTAVSNDTYSRRLNAITQLGLPSMGLNTTSFGGTMNVTVSANDSLPYASWDTKVNFFSSTTDSYSDSILTNSTGCAGSPLSGVKFYSGGKRIVNVTYSASCSSPLTVTIPFTSVQTGITVGSYALVAVCDTTQISSPKGYPNNAPKADACFAAWVKTASIGKGKK